MLASTIKGDLSGKVVFCVRCVEPGNPYEPVHVFSTADAAAEFCKSDRGRMHVTSDYVIDCPERAEQRSN